MNKRIKIMLLLLTVSAIVSFSPFVSTRSRVDSTLETLKPKEITISTPSIKVQPLNIKLKDHHAFLDAIGHQESGNRYKVVNRFGYMGKYQFGKTTLEYLKIISDPKVYLNSPGLQEEAMQRLLVANKKSLRKVIKKHAGTIHRGIIITESGLLAAAHLGGAGSVKRYFRTGKVKHDGNGMKITTYMEKFSGYSLDL
tara:strand:+ start:1019 stop:1609 length:591 start_codon:yes stop_codon:yes gene_type:complete